MFFSQSVTQDNVGTDLSAHAPTDEEPVPAHADNSPSDDSIDRKLATSLLESCLYMSVSVIMLVLCGWI